MRKNYMIRGVLLLFLALTFFGSSFGQAFCPGDTTFFTDSSSCEAVANFSAPVFDSTLNAEFSYTGDTAMWVVPAGIDSVWIETWGGQGHSNAQGLAGGLGGYASGWLPVSANDTLYIFVGGGADTTTVGGWNGGGMAGDTVTACSLAYAGGGGGGSDVRVNGNTLNDRVIIAGGGGGAGGNRVQGCGRGTGGGGGGGYYGGGGGAAWPYQSTVVPTGGTQSAGGTGGTSTWTSFCTGCNYGHPGGLGYGGFGGEEETGSQGGSAVALTGGTGGGLTGGVGSYSANWTGQSGAGGSGYIGGVSNGSMQDGVHAGAGMVVITYGWLDTIIASGGVEAGDTLSAGTYNPTWVASYGNYMDTCSFMVTVADTMTPMAVCKNETLSLDASGMVMVVFGDIEGGSTDNCQLTYTVVADTFDCADVGTTQSALLIVTDPSGNSDDCTGMITIVDDMDPSAMCQNISVILDANGNYALTPQEIDNGSSDNCSIVSMTVTPTSFDTSNVGNNTVTLVVTDASGNMDSCTATVMVQDTSVGIWENIGLSGIELLAYPNPVASQLSVQVSCDNCQQTETMKLQLLTVQGQVIRTEEVNLVNGVYQVELSLGDMAAGLYMLNLSSAKGSISQRVVKK